MNDQEKVVATFIYDGIQRASNYSPRSQQSREFKVGVSDLGFCSERVRRMLDQQVPQDTEVLAAFIGTAIGEMVETQVVPNIWPNAIVQSEVTLTLTGESGREYVLTGHPDIIEPNALLALDIKTVDGLAMVQRSGPSLSQQFQRHCYAKAAHDAGMFGEASLDEISVGNIWIDRSGKEKWPHVQIEPYSQEIVDHAGQWLDDVVYAYLQGEETRKEPPREMCAVACGFYDVCRAYDTDVEGLITDKTVLTAVDMYREGLELEKQAKRLKDQAKGHLVGVSGSTGEFMVRWTHINESVIPESRRKAYDKLEVRTIPKRKRAT